ncbi:MAG: TraR/DksA C4-type zinc finger protein [Ktedonobacteraceae bacterium]|nr:TraR/DksA C4-type zinc finger protein [Ktedonobacteraceae bacterium]
MAIDLQKMKQRLEVRRRALQAQIRDQTEAYPTPVDPIEASQGPQEFEETAVDFLEMQQEQSVVYNARALLTEVEAALQRIDEGTYGFCVVCGQPIPEKRLEAIPWTARCVQDEERLERRNLGQE